MLTPYYNIPDFTLYQGDSLELLKSINEPVDMIFADPPYFLSTGNGKVNINGQYIKFDKVEIDRINLGKKLKEARKSINYTQEKLASKLNTTHSVISTYESGKSTVSTLFIIEIAKLTNKSLNWLLNKVQ